MNRSGFDAFAPDFEAVRGAPTTRYAKTRSGSQVGYQVIGDGPLDLVYVPTWWSNVDAQWDVPEIAEFLTRLSKFSRLIVFDKRGVGVSDPVPLASLPTLEEWMDDLRAVLDAVGSERAALCGVLGGGLMCMLFAATYPERVSTLILLDAYARFVSAPDYEPGIAPDDVEPFIEGFVRDWSLGGFMYSRSDDAQTHPNREVWARFNRLCAPPGTVEAIERMTLAVDLRDIVPTVRTPTVVLYSTPARPLDFAPHARWLQKHLPHAEVEVEGLPGSRGFLSTREQWLGRADKLRVILTGVRGPVETDRVLATVLFTDIVSSTDGAVALGDSAWRSLLERYRLTVREHLHHFRGREVNTRGDDFLATFDGPARAIRCAQATATATRELGLEVRTGLHTGEVELLGDDIAGITVHVGARVSELAAAGDVLVSRTVVDLVAGSGIEFEDQGEHELKGVPGTWRLYRVVT
jgi:class 3 adenylate cyclase/pimeloyl-ACP methyl ester carboxylesterase